MVISHPDRFIFLHIPKNAGTSIEKSLTGTVDWKAADKHLTAVECIESVGEDVWQTYFTFCIVRNPWDRLVSQFQFNGDTWCKRYFGRPLEFNDFVKKVVAPGLSFSRHDYLSKIGKQFGDPRWDQFSRISDGCGQIVVDFIGRYENLQADYDAICEKIGAPQQALSISNRSTRDEKAYWDYYDSEAAEIVASTFSEEIAYFEYEFARMRTPPAPSQSM